MKINQDWHIHTESSCDEACMKMEDLVHEAKRLGIQNFGVSDHLHTDWNMPDIVNSKKQYDLLLSKTPELKQRFHFGVEVSCVSDWELDKIRRGDYSGDITYGLRRAAPQSAKPAVAIDREIIEEMGISYVVGGVHWPLYGEFDRNKLIRDYHRQYMFLAENPDVDILAHYLWWLERKECENPFADFGNIPASMTQELAAALKENSCAYEINLEAMLYPELLTEKFKCEYLEYAALLQSMGVVLSIGSDCHSRHLTEIDYETYADIIEKAGIDLNKNIFCVSRKSIVSKSVV